jgi:hypothetical protein
MRCTWIAPTNGRGALLSFLREVGAAGPHAHGAGRGAGPGREGRGSVGARDDRVDPVAPGLVDGLVVLTNEAADRDAVVEQTPLALGAQRGPRKRAAPSRACSAASSIVRTGRTSRSRSAVA